MPANFSLALFRRRINRSPRTAVRLGLGLLVAANLVAAILVFHPFGGSAGDLERQILQLQQQVQQKKAEVERTRSIVNKVEKGREEGDQFMRSYFLGSRTVNSDIYSELKDSAGKAGLQVREHTFAYDPIDGSDDLSMLTITGNYEGTYQQLIKFVNLVDRSPRLLIIETLQAQPQQQSKTLTISMKLNAFVRASGGGL